LADDLEWQAQDWKGDGGLFKFTISIFAYGDWGKPPKTPTDWQDM
jgi:hypothetical protein